MRQLVIVSLLLSTIHITDAMQKARAVICNKPLLSMATTAATTGLLTLAATHSKELQHYYRDAQKQKIRKALAEEHAQMSLGLSDR